MADQEKPNKANSHSNIRIGTEAENVSFTSKNTTSGKCESNNNWEIFMDTFATFCHQ